MRSLERGSEAARELETARAELDQALEELRELARGLHPHLSDRGLDAALEGLARRAPLPVELEATAGGRLPERVESAAYFVVAEALHERLPVLARQPCQRQRDARQRRRCGRGRRRRHRRRGPGQGSGLRGLLDRVSALDGRLEVESPVAQGTIVRARIPCE